MGQLAEKTGATVYLFGSYARGDHMLESDVDVTVISQDFERMSFSQRVERVREMLPEHLGFDIIRSSPNVCRAEGEGETSSGLSVRAALDLNRVNASRSDC